MPVLPPGAPYDTTETVLNFARVIANDCALSIAGNVLSDSQPYVYPMLNLAWRKLQDKLGNNAIESFPQEAILLNVAAMPGTALLDLSTQAMIDFDGYFDGLNSNPTPILPQDLDIPIKLWERPSNQPGLQFTEMISISPLPSRQKLGNLLNWEWRDDALYFIGASQSVDIRLRYKKFMDDMGIDPSSTIPLIRCAVALAYLVVEIFAESRGSVVSAKFTAQKDESIKQLINNTTRKKQHSGFRRQSYSRRRR